MKYGGNNDVVTVSIIVPMYNAEDNIAALIESLLNQDYPSECFEIIVIDNNSTDKSRDIVRSYPVRLLFETDKQTSYAARNRGIAHAAGEILAFIDSDCRPTPNWLRKGVVSLVSTEADLVGGRVEFVLSEQRTIAELYDSITNIQVGDYIHRHNVAPTANLFVKSLLFKEIGLFREDVRSGGDSQWTGKATRQGYRLEYAPAAVVQHPARRLKSLLRKKYRVGGGVISAWIAGGRPYRLIMKDAVRWFFPPRLSAVKQLIAQKGTDDMPSKIMRIWGLAYLCHLAIGLGILRSLVPIGWTAWNRKGLGP